MQLQIASAALKFCVVVGLWSIYVADWQLALANICAVAIGYRWLRQIRTKRGRTSAGQNHSAEKISRSPLSEHQRKPSVEHVDDLQRGYPPAAARAVEEDRCHADGSDPSNNTLSGSTVAVAAAFLTAFADSRETKADAKAKPAAALSKQSLGHDAASASLASHHQARRLVEAPQQPKSRKSALVRQGASDASNDMVDPEAERAARRAEMELLELLDAEAHAQQPRKKTTPVATASTGIRGATESCNSGATGSEDPADLGRGSAAGSDSQALTGGAAPRKGQKQAQKPVEAKAETRRPNKKQVQRPADAKTDSRLQRKASDTGTELVAEAAAAVAAVTPQRPSEKIAPASAPSKKELRRRRAGQKVGHIEDEDEDEEEDARREKSQQKEDGLAAVLSAVAKSNALNSSRTMTRAQSEALSSTTMGSSGSTSSLTSPESIIANSEASSDSVLVESSGNEPRAAASGLGDCESIEERPKASKKGNELVDRWSRADAGEGAESMDGEVADWVNRISSVDDCFDFTDLQSTQSQEPHSLAQVQLVDEVTRCQAPAAVASQFDANTVVQPYGRECQVAAPVMSHSDPHQAGQPCVRELFPATSQPPPSLQPASKTGEGGFLAAELRAIFPSASIHIGPPAEGSEVSGTAPSPTLPTACPTPPLATTQTLTHTMHYSSTTSSIISAGVPQSSTVGSVGLPNELHPTAPTVHFSSHVSSISSAGPRSEQKTTAQQSSTTQGTAHPNCFGTLSQTTPSGLHGGVVGSVSPNSAANPWVSSNPLDPANVNYGGSSHCGSSSLDGAASSKNPPLAAEVLFNLPSSASLGPTPAGALSVAQVEASTKASAWRAQLRRNGVQHLTEVEHALRRRGGPGEQTPSAGMYAAHSCQDGKSQTEGSNWQAENLSEGVQRNRWMQNPVAGEHPVAGEQVPGEMMHQDMVSHRWHADHPFAAPSNMDLMGTCGDTAMEQIGASEVWRDQSLLSAASAPPKLWENQAASLAPQQYAESQAQYQAAFDQMYKSILVARLEAAVPESYED